MRMFVVLLTEITGRLLRAGFSTGTRHNFFQYPGPWDPLGIYTLYRPTVYLFFGGIRDPIYVPNLLFKDR